MTDPSGASFILPSELHPSHIDNSDLDSLPSETTTEGSSDLDYSDADREWRESLQQIELLLTMILVPYIGRYFGRKCAYWGWGKFMEWKYPVKVQIMNPGLFKGAGVIEAAAASL